MKTWMRRGWIVVVVAGMALAVALPWLLLPHEPRFTETQWQQLHCGMSVDEATAILGCPPGDYTGGKGNYVGFLSEVPVESLRFQYTLYWAGEEGAIGAKLDEDQKLWFIDFYPSFTQPTLWERVQSRLSLRKPG